MDFVNFLFILVGIITAGLALANFDWYFNLPRARMWASFFGSRDRARIVLIAIGLLLIIYGLVR